MHTLRMIKIYTYEGCSTCKKALSFLRDKKIKFETVPIVTQPPSFSEIKKMLSYIEARGDSFKKLFNTSGQLYREMGIGQKLKDGLGEEESLRLLAKHGKLIKRPFLLTASNGGVGFQPELWKRLISS